MQWLHSTSAARWPGGGRTDRRTTAQHSRASRATKPTAAAGVLGGTSAATSARAPRTSARRPTTMRSINARRSLIASTATRSLRVGGARMARDTSARVRAPCLLQWRSATRLTSISTTAREGRRRHRHHQRAREALTAMTRAAACLGLVGTPIPTRGCVQRVVQALSRARRTRRRA